MPEEVEIEEAARCIRDYRNFTSARRVGDDRAVRKTSEETYLGRITRLYRDEGTGRECGETKEGKTRKGFVFGGKERVCSRRTRNLETILSNRVFLDQLGETIFHP